MTQGLSVADLTARARVGSLRRNGHAAAEDPMERALADDRRLQANAITRRSIRELEAEALRAEADGEKAKLDLIRAEIERAKLEAEKSNMQTQTTGSDDGLKEFLIGEVQDLRGTVSQMRETMTAAQMGALNDRLNALSAELSQARNSDNGSLGQIKDRLEEAQALMAMVQSPATEGDEGTALKAYRLRLEDERDRRKEEMQLRRDDSEAQRSQDRDLRERELAMQEAHYGRLDRFMEKTAPQLLETAQSLLSALMNRGAAPNNGTGAAAGAAPAAPRPLVMQPGVQTMPCPQCQTVLYYRPEWPGVICSNCLSIIESTDDQEPAEVIEMGGIS